MPLPHYGGGQQPTPDKEFIYLGKDMDVKPYLWYYGANPLKFIKNNKYKKRRKRTAHKRKENNKQRTATVGG